MVSVTKRIIVAGMMIAIFMFAQYGNIGLMKSRATTTECDAEVTPHQPWSEDGTASVFPLTNCNTQDEIILPLKHASPNQDITIKRAEYPAGLVIVPTTSYPSDIPAILPLKISNDDSIIFREQWWPHGAVGIFIDE